MRTHSPLPLPLSSRRWYAFSAGVVVGVAAGLTAVGLAVTAQRTRRRTAGAASASPPHAPIVYPPPPETELDEELAQTFPASDPLPYSHRVD